MYWSEYWNRVVCTTSLMSAGYWLQLLSKMFVMAALHFIADWATISISTFSLWVSVQGFGKKGGVEVLLEADRPPSSFPETLLGLFYIIWNAHGGFAASCRQLWFHEKSGRDRSPKKRGGRSLVALINWRSRRSHASVTNGRWTLESVSRHRVSTLEESGKQSHPRTPFVVVLRPSLDAQQWFVWVITTL